MLTRFGKILVLLFALATAAAANPAHAYVEVRSGDFYTGGALSQAAASSWSGGYSYGYSSGFSGGYGLGQWPQQDYIDMTPLYVSNIYNWGWAQPMGFSYLPPMGLGAIGNSMNFGAIGYGITPWTFPSQGSYGYGGYGYGAGRAF